MSIGYPNDAYGSGFEFAKPIPDKPKIILPPNPEESASDRARMIENRLKRLFNEKQVVLVDGRRMSLRDAYDLNSLDVESGKIDDGMYGLKHVTLCLELGANLESARTAADVIDALIDEVMMLRIDLEAGREELRKDAAIRGTL